MKVRPVVFRKHNHIFNLKVRLLTTFDLFNSQGKVCSGCLVFNGSKGIRKSDLFIMSLLNDCAKPAQLA